MEDFKEQYPREPKETMEFACNSYVNHLVDSKIMDLMQTVLYHKANQKWMAKAFDDYGFH